MPSESGASPAAIETAPKIALNEAEKRRAEAVADTVKAFIQSRRSLTNGRFSESERLIRFFEGVALSLKPKMTSEDFEEAERAFRAARQYTLTEAATPDSESGLLALQAEYNAAVIAHWRYLKQRSDGNEMAPDSLQKVLGLYTNVISQARRRLPPEMEQAAQVSGELVKLKLQDPEGRWAAIFLGASVGKLNLLLTAPEAKISERAGAFTLWQECDWLASAARDLLETKPVTPEGKPDGKLEKGNSPKSKGLLHRVLSETLDLFNSVGGYREAPEITHFDISMERPDILGAIQKELGRIRTELQKRHQS